MDKNFDKTEENKFLSVPPDEIIKEVSESIESVDLLRVWIGKYRDFMRFMAKNCR
jgi:hypothetical protein